MAKQESGFAERLKELRQNAGLSQSQLAEKAGLHLHSLTKLEHGDREPSWATVQALAKALGVDCTAFSDDPPAKPKRRKSAD